MTSRFPLSDPVLSYWTTATPAEGEMTTENLVGVKAVIPVDDSDTSTTDSLVTEHVVFATVWTIITMLAWYFLLKGLLTLIRTGQQIANDVAELSGGMDGESKQKPSFFWTMVVEFNLDQAAAMSFLVSEAFLFFAWYQNYSLCVAGNGQNCLRRDAPSYLGNLACLIGILFWYSASALAEPLVVDVLEDAPDIQSEQVVSLISQKNYGVGTTGAQQTSNQQQQQFLATTGTTTMMKMVAPLGGGGPGLAGADINVISSTTSPRGTGARGSEQNVTAIDKAGRGTNGSSASRISVYPEELISPGKNHNSYDNFTTNNDLTNHLLSSNQGTLNKRTITINFARNRQARFAAYNTVYGPGGGAALGGGNNYNNQFLGSPISGGTYGQYYKQSPLSGGGYNNVVPRNKPSESGGVQSGFLDEQTGTRGAYANLNSSDPLPVSSYGAPAAPSPGPPPPSFASFLEPVGRRTQSVPNAPIDRNDHADRNAAGFLVSATGGELRGPPLAVHAHSVMSVLTSTGGGGDAAASREDNTARNSFDHDRDTAAPGPFGLNLRSEPSGLSEPLLDNSSSGRQ
ncbi:unnamed protein product [Amoebophrya sp. A120]|nr:unnamed protein product [Amoebophrya sp. A120]|eukprot:GSA120T00025048001.1